MAVYTFLFGCKNYQYYTMIVFFSCGRSDGWCLCMVRGVESKSCVGRFLFFSCLKVFLTFCLAISFRHGQSLWWVALDLSSLSCVVWCEIGWWAVDSNIEKSILNKSNSTHCTKYPGGFHVKNVSCAFCNVFFSSRFSSSYYFCLCL